ncbi:MAG TPA: hypothetical protein VK638_39090 [Edaphobacter sp.]|nr:hypothetical protein [Edaphobacter sp.]
MREVYADSAADIPTYLQVPSGVANWLSKSRPQINNEQVAALSGQRRQGHSSQG